MSAELEAIGIGRAQRTLGGVADVAGLALPAVLQTLSDTLMLTVDSAIVGRLGVAELGGVGFGGIWLWTMMVIFVGAATGVQTFVARGFGAGDEKSCGDWLWHGIYALVPASIVWFAFIGIIFEPLIALFGPSDELRHLASAYAHARLFGAPAVIAAIAFISFFRGVGDTRTPLYVTIAANIVNAVVSCVLVFGLLGFKPWGVAGAGAGTAIANWFYLAMIAVAYRRWTKRRNVAAPPRPRLEAVRRYLRTSAPIGGQWFLDMASFALFSAIVARMGDAQMAATQAMIQLLSLSFMQAFGISIASAALVGRYLGAGDVAAAERTHRSAMKLGLVLATAVAALFLTIPDVLLGIFTSDAEVLRLGRPLLALGAVFQMMDAAGIIAAGSLRGAGDTRWPFLMQASYAWLLRLPLVYALAVLLRGGVTGAWLGELGYVTALGVTWLARVHHGAWRTVRI